jgi:uncharacterized protein
MSMAKYTPVSASLKETVGPGSDCGDDNRIQTAICRSPELKAKYRTMIGEYRLVAETLPLQQLRNLRGAQGAWSSKFVACEQSVDIPRCMALAYNTRIAELRQQTRPGNTVGRYEKIVNPMPVHAWSQKAGDESGKSIAIVVGISHYSGGYPTLSTASADADKMVRFLIDDAGFDVVYVVTEESATKQKIDQLMTDEIPHLVGRFDRFMFYWSGHGDQMISGGRTFGFLPVASSKPLEFSSMISMEDIARWDRYLQSKQALFILDSCFGGLAGVEQKARTPTDEILQQLSQSSHMLITAGTAGETVISSSAWRGSLFTDSFILGAKGEAHRSFDVVTLYSLIAFIQERVAAEKIAVNYQNNLTPQVFKLQADNRMFFFLPYKKN